MHNFKELNIWKLSMDIAADVNILVESMSTKHLWTLGSQLLKTAVSVPSNIAEGCGRTSDAQFIYFLNVAIASTFELETQILLAIRFNSVNQTKAEEVLNPNPSLEILFASRSLRVPSLNCCETKHLLVFWVLNRRTVKRNRGNYL